MRPTRTSRVGSRSRCRPAPSRSRSSAGSAIGPCAGPSRSTTSAAPRWSCRSSAVAGPRATAGSRSTATSTSSRRRRHCSRLAPRACDREPARDPVGRSPHQRGRPAGRGRGRPRRRAPRRHGQREPPEHARPHRPARDAPRRPADGQRRPARGPDGRPARVADGDWADAAHAQGGLAVAVHFPLPYAEVAADIVAGRIDAVEMQALTPGVDGPSIREWYRFLELRLPAADRGRHRQDVGRDPARGDPDVRPTRARTSRCRSPAWAEAVRAGRTFVSSGAFIDLEVDGHGPGDVVALGARRWHGRGPGDGVGRAAGHRCDSSSSTTAGGRDLGVGAGADGPPRAGGARHVSRSGWLAARVTSRAHIHSAFSTSMGAHSSPVYLDVGGQPAVLASRTPQTIGTDHRWGEDLGRDDRGRPLTG